MIKKLFVLLLIPIMLWGQQSSPPALPSNLYTTPSFIGGVNFPLTAPNGSASAPSYSFTSATGMGFYTNGSVLAFAVSGSNVATMDTTIFATTDKVSALGYVTSSNCSSSASPAVCGSASAGSVVVAAAATTVQVNTTAVTANSQILLTRDDSLGTKLSVTCNTATVMGEMKVSARTAGSNFTITVQTTPATNPGCINYSIIN